MYCKGMMRNALMVSMLVTYAGFARAERPMAVDDAGTLDRGGAKVEFGWAKDGKVRGFEGAVGYAPIDDLELEFDFGRARDHEPAHTETIRALGAVVKWVPLKSDVGLSAGLKYEYINERVLGDASAHGQALTGLFTWSFEAGPLLHVNLGREWVDADDDGDAANVWGVGLDVPLTGQLHVTVETFGAQHARPDRQIGLRYEIAEGLKISGAVGRGNDRNIANVGVAWEF